MALTMQIRRARSAGFVSGLAILLGATALTAPGTARAQAVAQQQGVVQRISVSGNERIEQSTILSYLPIGVGDTVDPARIDLALKALFRTDLFSDVKVGLTGGDLTIQVVENPIINRVVFEGNAGLKEDKLRDEITVRPRGIFTRAKVQADIQRIIELYRRSGRISAVVTPKIIELPQKRVDLIFEIDEGKKSGVLGVNFLGNSEFSDNDPPGIGSSRAMRTTIRTGWSTTRNSSASITGIAASTISALSPGWRSFHRRGMVLPSPTRWRRAPGTSSARSRWRPNSRNSTPPC